MVSNHGNELASDSQLNHRLRENPIAIVGMAGVFPESKNLEEYWEKIIHEVDCIREVPSSRWDTEDYYDPDPRAADKTYCKRGGFIPDIDFNPVEFGLPPNLLEVTDVAQLIALVIAKQAVADAGYAQMEEARRERVGVILGAASTQLGAPLGVRLQYPVWRRVLQNCGLPEADTEKVIEKLKSAYLEWTEDAFPGMLNNVITGRIANRLDFGGVNFTVDAACASSLAAVKMAVGELLNGNCDMMLTGGVDVDNSPFSYLCFSKTPALSKRQETRPFDVNADGMMLGEGVGIMVIKRLKDALRDGDRIYSLIKGVGTSSDGKYKSIYAPRPAGQLRALRAAYEGTDVSPHSVTLMEAHGTGTMAGDPAEVESLRLFFGQEQQVAPNQIALGSIKSQIGHTKAAAGAASLIKVALALHHKILPATINVTQPNPKLELDGSPFYVNTETRPWIRTATDSPRRAGVSSFGFGGANYHIVLEEHETEHSKTYRLHQLPQMIVLASASPSDLVNRCQEVLRNLQSGESEKYYVALVQDCKVQNIPMNAARIGFVAADLTEAIAKLQTAAKFLAKQNVTGWDHPNGIFYRPTGMELSGKVVALFPGQGSQYLKMAIEMAAGYPELRQAFSMLDGLLSQDQLNRLSAVVYPRPAFEPEARTEQEKLLRQTEYAQPAIAAVTMGMYKILQQAGFRPDFAAGHSFGELSALWAAGVFSDEDYCYLVKARGQAMATPADSNFDAGAMLAVVGNAQEIETLLPQMPGVTIANYNSNTQVVLAGAKAAIASAQTLLSSKGLEAKPLPVSAAFHTSLVSHAQQPFAQAIASVSINAPQITTYTNVTAQPYPDHKITIQQTLQQHMLNSVLFKQEIENIYNAGGYCFVEVGPRSVLTHLVKEVLGDRPHIAVALNASRQKDSNYQFREAIVQLRVAGLPLQDIDPYQVPHKLAERSKGLYVKMNGRNFLSDKTKQRYEDALKDGYRLPLATAAAPATSVAPQPVTPAATVPIGSHSNSNQNNSSQNNSSQNNSSQNNSSQNNSSQNNSSQNASGQAHPQSIATTSAPVKAPTSAPAAPVVASSNGSPNGSTNGLKEVTSASATGSANAHSSTNGSTNGSSKSNGANGSQPNGSQPNGSQPNGSQPKVAEFIPLTTASLNGQPPANGQAKTNGNGHGYGNGHGNGNGHRNGTGSNGNGNGHSPSVPAAATVTRPAVTAPTPASSPSAIANRAVNPVHRAIPNQLMSSNPSMNFKQFLESFESSLTEFNQHQAEALKVHSQYLNNQSEYSKIVFQLMREQSRLLASGALVEQAPEVREEVIGSVERSMMRFHDHQEETLRVHEQSLNYHAEHMKQFFQLVQQQYGMVKAEAPIEIAQPVNQPISQPVQPKVAAPAPEMVAATAATAATVTARSTNAPTTSEAIAAVPEMKAAPVMAPVMAPVVAPVMAPVVAPAPRVAVPAAPTVKLPTPVAPVPQPAAPAAPAAQPTAKVAPPAPIKVEPVAPAAPATPAAIAPAPVAPASVAPANDNLAEMLVQIVSEKTGYPTEMLELDMDMEADLGIDSIKRVEILGALQEQFPDIPKASPEDVGEVRTLGQIVDSIRKLMGTAATTATATVAAPTAPAPENAIATSPVNPSVNPSVNPPVSVLVQAPAAPVAAQTVLAPTAVAVASAPVVTVAPADDNLAEMLVQIVSEKTGYPTEMLELDMDMEADLGIDSIKRVEILGALQEQFPDIPKASPEDVGEVRTLGQIVDSIRKLMGTATSAPAIEAPAISGHHVVNPPVIEAPVIEAPVIEAPMIEAPVIEAQAPAVTAGVDEAAIAELSATLVRIVSEKTGYPPEMLELDMDMEADLGIDSIKRVEILGALQEHYPELPRTGGSEDVGEIRTLAQIVEVIAQKLSTAEKKTL